MLRSSSPKTNQDGSSCHSGRSPDGSTSASWVTGRCVAAMRAACGAGTSAQNCSWKRSSTIVRSVVPSLRGAGCSASPSVLPGKAADKFEAAVAGLRSEGSDIDEPDDLPGVGVDVRDDGAAVGVADEHDEPLDRAEMVADAGGVGGESPQRVRDGDHRM